MKDNREIQEADAHPWICMNQEGLKRRTAPLWALSLLLMCQVGVLSEALSKRSESFSHPWPSQVARENNQSPAAATRHEVQ